MNWDMKQIDDELKAITEKFSNVIDDLKDEAIINAYYESKADGESEYFTEAKELHSGVFWVITEHSDLSGWNLLMFDIPCDTSGNVTGETSVRLNAKSGNTYNHKKLWESEIKNNPAHKPYNRREYDYYPRGRVDISNNSATIYLNHHINVPEIIRSVKVKFGLIERNISKVRVFSDGSDHYKCFIDRE